MKNSDRDAAELAVMAMLDPKRFKHALGVVTLRIMAQSFAVGLLVGAALMWALS